MGAASGRVKGGRRYDASSRRARAAERRDLVLRTAEEMFLRDGYAAVTVRALADATGTSQETIYKTYGGKAGLVAAIQEAALQGSGPVPAPERSDAMSLGESDADVILRQWATLSMEVAPRVSPVMLLVRSSASTDPQMRELWDQMADRRRERMAHNADRLLATGQVRAGSAGTTSATSSTPTPRPSCTRSSSSKPAGACRRTPISSTGATRPTAGHAGI